MNNISESELINEFTETICQLYANAEHLARGSSDDVMSTLKENINEVEYAKQKLMDDPKLLEVMTIMFSVISKRRNKLAAGESDDN